MEKGSVFATSISGFQDKKIAHS